VGRCGCVGRVRGEALVCLGEPRACSIRFNMRVSTTSSLPCDLTLICRGLKLGQEGGCDGINAQQTPLTPEPPPGTNRDTWAVASWWKGDELKPTCVDHGSVDAACCVPARLGTRLPWRCADHNGAAGSFAAGLRRWRVLQARCNKADDAKGHANSPRSAVACWGRRGVDSALHAWMSG
jgi:hypothetical protein